ncbi:fumarylacetoacetate hydrolase family protein [Rhizorhabdus sp.]|jgi:2-keto-4-pentenoate hydratase/2-oxohepta-3-ene-1,7-dioic acid hydratase in catechol pathway|uniref:fumarylacetoacetate hydrolase family protein n=1 Tax=Rhizorhabdus sp. TaxID=1968843 RepID=UPI00198D0E56|nr:fumarylacetoacetate hydrolase family protein [Rhizorhabdus sp.]MBD3759353.1 fumarylacetoacetate hydrolase family protein [Rhizorhabdus sp.]
MKLLRYAQGNTVFLGAIRDGAVVSLEPLKDKFPTMTSIIEGGQDALAVIASFVASEGATIPLAGLQLLAPVERPGKYLAIGMNYPKHVQESKRLGGPIPDNQFWFNKQTTCLAGPFDDIDPHVTTKLDYEAELGVVIGAKAKDVTEAEARNHVFGYLVANDVSARDWQMHSPTFTMGKSFDTHGPVGPWIVTADEIPDPHALQLRCWVNGELRQDVITGEMIFNIWQQISYLSTAFTLEPGDLLATGTPSGVGIAMEPPVYLQPGDVVRCDVQDIGFIENKVVRS